VEGLLLDEAVRNPPVRVMIDSLIEIAINALQAIGLPAVPAIVELVEGLLLRMEQSSIPGALDHLMRTATNALGAIGAPEAVPVLLRALQLPGQIARRSISSALLEIGGPAVMEGLRGLLHDPACSPEVRPTVRQLLQRLNAPEL